MTLVVVAVVLFVLLILLTNTKRWKSLARGARRAKNELETEVKKPES
jgi:hypothetical protein